MRDPTGEKFRMMWLKLYFYKARGGCCKTVCEVAWANAISAKFKRVSIKLTECGLDYLLILIKFEWFFIKLPSLPDNPSRPRAIRWPGYSGWRGSMWGQKSPHFRSFKDCFIEFKIGCVYMSDKIWMEYQHHLHVTLWVSGLTSSTEYPDSDTDEGFPSNIKWDKDG